MEFDIFMILALAIAVIIGAGLYYLYQNVDAKKVNEVYGILKGYWEKYGVKLEEDNPELYNELEGAMMTMEKAMSDDEISILEAFEIAKAFLPLTKRLTEYIKKQYEE